MNDAQLLRYARHIMLEDFGFEAQEKLASSRVLILGMGGLGSPAAMYLAAAGVGTLFIADDDTVELSNLQRQIVHTTNSLGLKKVISAQQTLNALNPEVDVQVITHRLTETEAANIIQTVDIVLDCSDNYQTRHILNRLCVQARKPLVAAAAIRWDGLVTSFDFREDTMGSSPCYACLFDPEDNLNPDNCATLGVISPLLGVMGSMQALEAIKLLIGAGNTLVGRLAMFNAKRSEWKYLSVAKNRYCSICKKSSS